MYRLHTVIPDPLPKGRKVLPCSAPGCPNVEIHNLDVERCHCHFHVNRSFPRDEQADLDITLPEAPSAPGPQPPALSL